VLERANEKFEFPVKWGIDLQSEHELLPEKYAKKPVIVMNCPKDIKAFYMRGERRRPDGRGDGRAGAGDRRDHRRQPARGAARGAGPEHGERGIDQEHCTWYRDLRRAQRERDGKPESPCAPGSIA
jgi:asparaginyl-tRNA synthetase